MPEPKALLLDCARIFEERGETHGHYTDSLGLIAEFWSVYLAQLSNDRIAPLSSDDVCHLLALLKIARSLLNPDNLDNYQDAAVYEVLAAACADATDGGDWRPEDQDQGAEAAPEGRGQVQDDRLVRQRDARDRAGQRHPQGN